LMLRDLTRLVQQAELRPREVWEGAASLLVSLGLLASWVAVARWHVLPQ